MPNPLDLFIPHVTRVVCPGGIRGVVEQVLPRFDRTGRPPKFPILVRRDDGSVKAYAPTELIRLAVEAQQQSQVRGPLP